MDGLSRGGTASGRRGDNAGVRREVLGTSPASTSLMEEQDRCTGKVENR
jgi:hypothetical protein